MGITRRIERLERDRRGTPVAPLETVEAYRLPPDEAEAQVRAALSRAEAIAGPWRPGMPPRVVIVNCVRREERQEGEEHTRCQ